MLAGVSRFAAPISFGLWTGKTGSGKIKVVELAYHNNAMKKPLMTKKPAQAAKPIKERIAAALADGKDHHYHDVLLAVFPPDAYPRAWRYQQNGGPPVCAMAFRKALRSMPVRDNAQAPGVRYLRLRAPQS
jgi:hypothetical protein